MNLSWICKEFIQRKRKPEIEEIEKDTGIEEDEVTSDHSEQEIADSIVKLIPTLLEKKIDLFSSKVNSNLLTLI